MLPLILKALAANGLTAIVEAVTNKGLDAVEKATGIKIDLDSAGNLRPEQAFELRRIEAERPEVLERLRIDDKRIDADIAKNEQQEVTKRWQGDMTSDSRLAKNIRPAVLIYLLGALTIFALMSAGDVDVAEPYIVIVGDLLEAAFYAYFGGRTLEKLGRIGADVWKAKRK